MTKRRLRGEGSIFYDRNAKLYVGQIDLGQDEQGRRRRPKVTGRTKREVADKLRELQTKAFAGLPIGDGKLTVGQFESSTRLELLRPDVPVE